MKRFAIITILVAFAGTTILSQEKEKKLPDPTPRKAEILKRFVDEFVAITPGNGKFPADFLMGSAAQPDEQPVHRVSFKRPFAVNKYETTQELYHVVMGSNPSKWKGLRNAVEMVSKAEAKQFCAKATEELRRLKLISDKEQIRLLSE